VLEEKRTCLGGGGGGLSQHMHYCGGCVKRQARAVLCDVLGVYSNYE